MDKRMRFVTLVLVSITMMFAYFFTDVMSPLESLLTAPSEAGGLSWSSDEYGFFSGSYGFFNVFLLLLFFGGIVLDKFGIRFTGVLSTLLMFGGALIKWWAVSRSFEGSVTLPFSLGVYSTQVILASLGFAIFGVGCEIACIAVSKVIVKWFTGYELAFAMGLQVALARIGTAAALAFSLPFAEWLGEVHHSVGLGAALLFIGLLAFLVYCVEMAQAYCSLVNDGVFTYSRTYSMVTDSSGETTEERRIYDRYGRGATLMLIGSVLLFLVHVVIALPLNYWPLVIFMMMVLGVAFGMVPSAMWPSVPKIIPMKLLGTAYALIFYIQNIGLSLVPIWIGKINQQHTDPSTGMIDYTETMTVFALFGLLAIVLSLLLLREDKVRGYGLEQRNIS